MDRYSEAEKEARKEKALKKATEWVEGYAKFEAKTQNVLIPVIVKGEISIETLKSESEVKDFMKHFHYLPDHSLIGRRIIHRCYDETGKTIAVLAWSNALSPSMEDRDRWIGCQGPRWFDWRKKHMNRIVANNVRYCIHPFIKNKENIASRCLAMSRKLLVTDWKKKYGDDLLFFETFIDTDKYKGTCYLADNWIDVGLSKGANFHGTRYGGVKWQLADVTTHVKVSRKIILLKPVYNNKKMYKLLSRIGLKSQRFYKEPMSRPPEFKSPEEKAEFKEWLGGFSYDNKKLKPNKPKKPKKQKAPKYKTEEKPIPDEIKDVIWVTAEEVIKDDDKGRGKSIQEGIREGSQ